MSDIRKTSSQSAVIMAEIKQNMELMEQTDQINKAHGKEPKKIDAKANAKKKHKKKDKMDLGEVEAFRHMDEHKIPLPELYSRYKLTDPAKGLTSAICKQRLEDDGPNVLTEKKGIPWYCLFIKEMTGFFSLLLWLGSILCFIGYSLDSSDPANLYLGIVLAIVVFVTGCFSFYQESKSAAIMAGFKNFVPPVCTVIRDGNTSEVEASTLVKGDIVDVKEGNRIPADIRVIYSNEMKVDNSSLTGEPDLLLRKVECTNEKNALETDNLAFFGTLCKAGKGQGIVISTGDRTVIGQIAQLTQSEESEETPLNKEIKRFIYIVSGVAFTLGITFFIFGVAIGYDYITNLVFCIGIIVANVPEGLLATVTVSLSLTAKRMAKKYVLVKNLEAVETLGSTTCICSDKTGTLTQNKMKAAHLWFNDTVYAALDLEEVEEKKKSKKYDNEDEITVKFDQNDYGFKMLQKSAICCSEANFNDEVPKEELAGCNDEAEKEAKKRKFKEDLKTMPYRFRPTVGDASESALIKFFQHIEDIKITRENSPIIQNEDKTIAKIPFNSSNKYALTIHRMSKQDNQAILFLKGAPERIWQRCTKVLVNGQEVPKDSKLEESYAQVNKRFARGGERVLGFSYLKLDLSQFPQSYHYDVRPEHINFPMENLVFSGLISLRDPPRDGVKAAVDKCRSAGIKVVMVTGDQPDTAAAIAKQVNIITTPTYEELMAENPGMSKLDAMEQSSNVVIHGETLAEAIADEQDLPDEQKGRVLKSWLRKKEIVFARTSPAQKLIIVSGCQELDHIVAVTGDGVNDSPAIKKADIGIAMGIVGSDVAKDAADMILLNDDFTSIVNGVEEGRLIFDNLKKSIAYTLSSNIPEIAPFLLFITIQLPLPLSTVLILCVDLGTDMVPAISLAYEQPELDIMNRKPRNAQTDHLVNLRLISFSYLQIGMVQALAGLYTYFVVMNDYGLKPSLLFQFALVEGIKPDDDDKWDEDAGITADSCYGNTKCNKTKYDDDDYSDRIDWNTYLDGEIDLRLFYPQYKDDWVDCRFTTDSPVSDKSVCYTTEALRYAQCAYFISIIVVQWADLMICKTRKLSITQQGMKNMVMNFGLCSETALGCFLCYVTPLNLPLGTRPLEIQHLGIPAFPFYVVIFLYDEIRKYIIRQHKEKYGVEGWIERNTYY